MSKVIKNYRNDDALRTSFNKLAGETFGLNFEDWYQNGFWGEHYNPYSIVQDGEVVANVSVNDTPVMRNGEKSNFIQLGTVMTKEAYRNRGYIREIMEEIDRDYAGKVDGMYLFASDSVQEFYPKFGYSSAVEYQYSKQVTNTCPATIKQVLMREMSDWKGLQNAIENSAVQGAFEPVENSGLYLFYVTKFMQEAVYYEESLDAYVIAEWEEDELLLHAVFAQQEVDLEEIIRAFGPQVKKVTLGFTPKETSTWECEEYKEEDCTLFIKGDGLEDFSQKKQMFALLGHA